MVLTLLLLTNVVVLTSSCNRKPMIPMYRVVVPPLVTRAGVEAETLPGVVSGQPVSVDCVLIPTCISSRLEAAVVAAQ